MQLYNYRIDTLTIHLRTHAQNGNHGAEETVSDSLTQKGRTTVNRHSSEVSEMRILESWNIIERMSDYH